jgi:tetratricopeptide (TPR) repeat protein
MQKPLEIIAINKRPPDDNGNPNYNSLKTVYSIAGTRISSKANEAPPLSNLEIENWAATIKSHSRGQKLERAHQFSLELFKKKRTKAAIDILLAVKPELETQHKIEILNDLGYFLEEADRYGEAIPVLEKVLAFENTRTPAYLNLGDAYQKSGEGSKAKANYQKYVELMEKGGKGAKVPARVRDILKH